MTRTETSNPRGERLRNLRLNAELTLRGAEEKVGLAFSQISKIEKNDAIYIKPSVLLKFAEVYRTTPEYIETGIRATLPLSSSQAQAFPNDVYAEGFLADMYPVDIPHLDPKARASFIELGIAGHVLDLSHLDTVRLYVSSQEEAARYKNALVFTVDGDSMEPLLYTGQRVIGWQVPEQKWESIHNKVCVVAYDDTVTIKAVRENELFTRGLLTLRAQNTEAGFLPIRREQINTIWTIEEFFDRPKVRL